MLPTTPLTSNVRWYFLQLVSNAILSDLVFPTVRLQPLDARFTLPFQEILFIKIIQVPLTCSQLSSSTSRSTVHPSLPSQLILPALARKKRVPVSSPEIPKHAIWLGPLWKLSLPPPGKQSTLPFPWWLFTLPWSTWGVNVGNASSTVS